MYKNIYYDKLKDIFHVWDDKKGYFTQKFKKYAYLVDSKGEYETLNGLKVKKVTEWQDVHVKQNVLFEHDVPITSRFLIDNYIESDEVSENITTLFFDIEVSQQDLESNIPQKLKYCKASEATNTITSIAAYDTINKKYFCWLLDLEGKLESNDTLFICKTEFDLLAKFITYWTKVRPEIVTGWNCEKFDIPYLINRCEKKLGITTTNKFSPINIISEETLDKDIIYKIAGVSILDYMELYKNFTYSEESSYSLEAISQKELKRGKIQYEGTLDTLFNADIDKFIQYNINDVELIVALDKKLDFIDIARGICHKGHCRYEDIFLQSRILDGAALTYCKRVNKVAPSAKRTTGEETKAEGAYVKLPEPGIYKYVFDLDLESMYPGNIRTLNISPETKWGKIENWNEESLVKQDVIPFKIYRENVKNAGDVIMGFKNDEIELTNLQIPAFLKENNLSLASNGILYDKTNKGFLPTILTQWFYERKEFNKKAAEYKLAGNDELYRYYDKKQLVQKILLNSFYGVLLMPSFRFYDKDNGEAVTSTGQALIKFSAKCANMFFREKIGETDKNKDFVLYCDTDSIFCSAEPILLQNNILNKDEDEIMKETLLLCKEVQDFINEAYNFYALKFHNVEDHVWNIKQEMVGKRAFWGSAKKRYAISIINKKGLPVNELEVKGLDVVRSSFPKLFRKFLKQLIIDILDDKTVEQLNKDIIEFKKIFKTENIFSIMSPTGVKEMSKYSFGQKGTPVHVKSAQNYNKLLEIFEISTRKIEDGDKIVWAYMKPNSYGFETMALTGVEDPKELIEFVEKNIDKDKVFRSTLMSKIEKIFLDLKFGYPKDTEEIVNDFF